MCLGLGVIFGITVLIVFLSAVLKARMLQLQSDVLHVKHSKVDFVKVSQGKKSGPLVTSQRTEAETPKAVQFTRKVTTKDNPPFKTHASRWIEKLNLERSNKTKKQQKLRDKTAAAKSSKGSLMAPGTAMKTISTTKRSKLSHFCLIPSTKNTKTKTTQTH